MRGGVPVLNRADCESQRIELLREVNRGRITCSTASESRVGADVQATAQKGSGGDHDCARAEATALERLDARHAPTNVIEEKARDGSLNRVKARVLLDETAHRATVQTAVALCARRPHCGALAAIEHSELECREIGRARHDSAQRVDLARDGTLGDSTDRRIARHLADRLERARDQSYTRAKSRRRYGRFSAGVAGAHDNDVELEAPCAVKSLVKDTMNGQERDGYAHL